jgi:hypothetical protein
MAADSSWSPNELMGFCLCGGRWTVEVQRLFVLRSISVLVGDIFSLLFATRSRVLGIESVYVKVLPGSFVGLGIIRARGAFFLAH